MSYARETQSFSDSQPCLPDLGTDPESQLVDRLLLLLVDAQERTAKAQERTAEAQERIAKALERQRLPHGTVADIEERDAISALSQLRERGERVSLAAIARHLGIAKETFRRRSAEWPTFQKFLDADAAARPAQRVK